MHLVRHLANTGHEIIAIARRTPPSANSLPSIVWRHVDSLSQLASQLQTWEDGQIDAIVHLAARVHVLDHDAGNDTEAFRRTNVDDTLALARAAKRMGARRFVFMSSVKVHGDESGAEPLTEDIPVIPAMRMAARSSTRSKPWPRRQSASTSWCYGPLWSMGRAWAPTSIGS